MTLKLSAEGGGGDLGDNGEPMSTGKKTRFRRRAYRSSVEKKKGKEGGAEKGQTRHLRQHWKRRGWETLTLALQEGWSLWFSGKWER